MSLTLSNIKVRPEDSQTWLVNHTFPIPRSHFDRMQHEQPHTR